MTIIFADRKQVNPTDIDNADAMYYVEVTQLTGGNPASFRYIAKVQSQVPQNGVTPITETEYLLPSTINNSSSAFFKNTLDLPQYLLDSGVPVTDKIAARLAYKWLESQ